MRTSNGQRNAYLAGKTFEHIFELNAKMQGFLAIKMPLGARWAGKKLIPIKTPFDYTLVHQGISVFIDTKTFKEEYLREENIVPHQIETLLALEQRGFAAGYLVWVREANVVYFAKASALIKVKNGDRLQRQDMIILGKVEDFSLGRLFSLTWERT